MRTARQLVGHFLRHRGRDLESSRIDASSGESLALEALSVLALHYERRTTQIAPVATLPRTALGARRSDTVLTELITGARDELIVLGYDVSDVKIIAALAERASLGVNVDLLVDSVQTPMERLLRDWPSGAGRARVWRTAEDSAGKSFRLHAKAVIVDGRRCMLGSANLTHSGLRTNLELGVFLDGPVVRRLRAYVREMVRRGVVVEAGLLGGELRR